MKSIETINGQEIPQSLGKTLEALDISRSKLYSMIDEGVAIPKYLGKKPYFFLSDIVSKMTERQKKF